MTLKEILAISGQSGLYRYIAQSTNGIIVESLADDRRSNVPSSARVSALAEISVYTDTEEVALGKIFGSIYEKSGGKETISHKSTPEQLKGLFAEILPDYDRNRVHISDMKKIVSWYNMLVSKGMTDFSIEEEEQAAKENETEEAGAQ